MTENDVFFVWLCSRVIDCAKSDALGRGGPADCSTPTRFWRHKHQRTAIEWIMSEEHKFTHDDGLYYIPFVTACELCGRNPQAEREEVMSAIEDRARKIGGASAVWLRRRIAREARRGLSSTTQLAERFGISTSRICEILSKEGIV